VAQVKFLPISLLTGTLGNEMPGTFTVGAVGTVPKPGSGNPLTPTFGVPGSGVPKF
jgi:hypothetical protein